MCLPIDSSHKISSLSFLDVRDWSEWIYFWERTLSGKALLPVLTGDHSARKGISPRLGLLLTFTTLRAHSADDKWIVFLFVQKTDLKFDISCKLSPKEKIRMDYQSLFSGKNIWKCHLLKLSCSTRKPASKNVVCFCHLLNILENFSNLFLHTGKQCGPWPDCS